jgi:hypothetical protein
MTALVAATLVDGAGAAPIAGGTAAPIVEPVRRPDVAVVVYRELIGEIAGPDRGPTLTIYGDGRVVAHYPVYMKRAGDWERRLARPELDALVVSLAAKGVLEFDAPSVRTAARASAESARSRARAARQPITLFEASDRSTTVIEMTVGRYVAATPGARAAHDVSVRAAWTGLREDAAQHPDVPALRDLAAAEAELRAVREAAGFTRVR